MRLENSPNGGFMVYHNFESSYLVEVKFKEHLDKPLMELKESVLGKLNELLSMGGWCLDLSRKVVCSRCRCFE